MLSHLVKVEKESWARYARLKARFVRYVGGTPTPRPSHPLPPLNSCTFPLHEYFSRHQENVFGEIVSSAPPPPHPSALVLLRSPH